MTSWNLLDILAAVLLAGGTAYGFHRGFIRQLLSLTGFIVAYFVAFAFYDNLAPALRVLVPLSSYEPAAQYEGWIRGLKLDTYIYNAVAFALLLFGMKAAISVTGHLLDWFSRVPGLNMVNRWSGALLGLTEMAVLLVVAIHVASYIPSDTVRERLEQSVAAKAVHTYTPEAAAKLAELFGKTESR